MAVFLLFGRALSFEKLRWNPETDHVLDDDKANAMITRESRKPWVNLKR